jgi:hypothetical protein
MTAIVNENPVATFGSNPLIPDTKCKLCHKEAELCDSHILPEFLYAPLYDEKHRFIAISTDAEKKEKFLQKGLREKMLCKDCEVKFSVYENYASGIIFGGVGVQMKQESGRLLLQDVDYTKFRLFQLSLLWRMGVAQDDFFSAVDLGPYEERIRNMLIADDPGDEGEIPCALTGVLLDGKTGNWFMPPDRINYLGQRCYRLVICGILFMFFVSKLRPPPEAMEFFIKRNAAFTILVRKIEAVPFLHDVCIKLGIAMANRPKDLRKTF